MRWLWHLVNMPRMQMSFVQEFQMVVGLVVCAILMVFGVISALLAIFVAFGKKL